MARADRRASAQASRTKRLFSSCACAVSISKQRAASSFATPWALTATRPRISAV